MRLGAQRAELAEVRRLVESPERPEAQAGWEATRRDLERLTALCHERRVRLCVLVFPYAFQVAAGGNGDDPQRRLVEMAGRLGIPVLDLLPLLRARAQADGVAPSDYFLDESHPSVLGSLVVGDRLAEFIQAERLLAEPP